MSIRAALTHLPGWLDALALDDPDSLQLMSVGPFDALHHPPLNPDAAALIPLAGSADIAASLGAIRRVLLNQYPGAHPVRLVHGTGAAWTVTDRALDALAQSPLSELLPDGIAALYVPPLPQSSSFARFEETIAHLRAPEGCPWDRKQTHASLRPYLLEETYEVLDALDSGSVDDLREELGDLLLQIVLHAQIAVDTGEFRMTDVIAAINEKIVRRHPHVWGMVAVNDEQDVKVNWDQIKQAEKSANGGGDSDDTPRSRLDGVPKSLPALSQSYSYQDRAARVNFDWDTIDPVIDKVREEIAELLAAEDAESRALETGDVLFAVVNWARWLDIDPESALRESNARFYRRFHYIEQQAAAQGRALDTMSLAEMDVLWDEAKANGL
ncbi:MAG: nucleoside triphosphate pyrophosphohydrolase [Anaerolineae bacterium]|nr:nucleoside triphosphate pyrophosphohydrolase [Anaerolineae bacterium]